MRSFDALTVAQRGLLPWVVVLPFDCSSCAWPTCALDFADARARARARALYLSFERLPREFLGSSVPQVCVAPNALRESLWNLSISVYYLIPRSLYPPVPLLAAFPALAAATSV